MAPLPPRMMSTGDRTAGRLTRPAALGVELITTSDRFFALREEWNRLLGASSRPNYFLSWEWLWHWWSAYGDASDRLRILALRDGGDLVGICPLYQGHTAHGSRLAPRRLLFLGTHPGAFISEHMDLLCRRGVEEAVLERTLSFLTEQELWDQLCLHTLPEDSPILGHLARSASEQGLRLEIVARHRAPYIPLPGTFEDFLTSCSASLGAKLRKDRRYLARIPGATVRRASDPTRFTADFDEFVRLHQLRWNSRGKAGSFANPRFAAFQRSVMRDMLQNGRLELWFLAIGGRNIAALYNIAFQGRISYFQSGLDAAHDAHLSPGMLLHAHCIEEAIGRGFAEYDFLAEGSTDHYKSRWTKTARILLDIELTRPGIRRLPLWLRSRVRMVRRQFGMAGGEGEAAPPMPSPACGRVPRSVIR